MSGEFAAEVIAVAFAVAEDEKTLPLVLLERIEEDGELLLGGNRVDDLGDGIDGSVLGVDRYLNGIGHPLRGERHHFFSERGRKEQGLTGVFRGQFADDALDVGNEAHVEHSICLIDDEDFDLFEVDDARTDEIEQTSWRGGNQINGSGLKAILLCSVIHTAKNGEGA